MLLFEILTGCSPFDRGQGLMETCKLWTQRPGTHKMRARKTVPVAEGHCGAWSSRGVFGRGRLRGGSSRALMSLLPRRSHRQFTRSSSDSCNRKPKTECRSSGQLVLTGWHNMLRTTFCPVSRICPLRLDECLQNDWVAVSTDSRL